MGRRQSACRAEAVARHGASFQPIFTPFPQYNCFFPPRNRSKPRWVSHFLSHPDLSTPRENKTRSTRSPFHQLPSLSLDLADLPSVPFRFPPSAIISLQKLFQIDASSTISHFPPGLRLSIGSSNHRRLFLLIRSSSLSPSSFQLNFPIFRDTARH